MPTRLVGTALLVGLVLSNREPASAADEKAAAPRSVIAVVNRGGCGNCHVIPGVPGADGSVGPDLSKLGTVAGTRKPKFTAKEYVRESILDPDAVVAPGGFEKGVMPRKFGKTLSADDVNKLVDYLAGLGVAPPKGQNQPKPELVRTRPAESARSAKATDVQLSLGKYLFFDRRLSANNALSCASCHQPDKAFTDGQPVSIGYPGTALFRNTPTLLNVSRAKSIYWDGRLSGADLPTVVRDHLTEPFFMAADGRLLVERMKQVPEYVELFRAAYQSEPSFGGILKAVAAYVSSLESPPAGDKALSAEAAAGKKLFLGKAGCATCHPVPLFTDHKFHDLGLRTDPKLLDDPERAVTFRRFFRGLGTPNYRNLTGDVGQFVLNFRDEDRHKFRTPSLREVSRTAPYMHDGRFATLEDVVEFYSATKKLPLSAAEKQHLVAYLKSLASEPVAVVVPEVPYYSLLPLGNDSPLPVGEKLVADVRKPRPITPLPPPPAPRDNPTTPAKVALGRLLYFDTRLSADGATSCNTCHPAHTGYTARTPISMGGTGTSHWRNSSTLYNVAYFQKFNWDGAKPSIEKQNDGAWTGAVAGNMDTALAEERLAQVPEYRKQFKTIFGETHPTWGNSLRAVAAYQRTLNSKNVPLDAFLKGNANAISDGAKRGFKLFTGKANCAQCHDGPLLSDDRYHNLGVPSSPDFLNSPVKQITFRYEQMSMGVPRRVYESARDDLGLYYVTKRAEDIGKFRTASLRELMHTAPYMHNGVLKTLPDVIDFYDAGGGTHANKSPLLRPLGLTKAEKADLIAFLESLSGDPLADKPPPLPPYGPHPPTKGK